MLTYTVDIHYKNLLVFFALEPQDDTDSELSSHVYEDEDHDDDLPDLIAGIHGLGFNIDNVVDHIDINTVEQDEVNHLIQQTNFILANPSLNNLTITQYLDDLVVIQNPIFCVYTTVETINSNSFKFGVRRQPWGVKRRWVNSLLPGGYGITASHSVEVIVGPNSIGVLFGSGLVADPIVEQTEEEAVYTVRRIVPLSPLFQYNHWA